MAMDAPSLFGRAIFNGIWERAIKEKCPLLLLPGAVGENSPHVESCRAAGVKGVIFLGGEGYAEALELRRDGFPVILANRPVGGTPMNFVDYDAAGELREILARFVALGHRHIGVLCPKHTSVPGYYARLRLDFIDLLSQHGLELSPGFYWKTVDVKNETALADITREWMDAPNPPTAVFIWIPSLAQKLRDEVFKYAAQKAQTLSIACSGYSYEREAEFSGFVMPHKECGAALLSGLHETIRNPFHVVQQLIPCRYVEKGSVRST
jgi:DNA-binding LacI/PurR family transcriptional regulator